MVELESLVSRYRTTSRLLHFELEHRKTTHLRLSLRYSMVGSGSKKSVDGFTPFRLERSYMNNVILVPVLIVRILNLLKIRLGLRGLVFFLGHHRRLATLGVEGDKAWADGGILCLCGHCDKCGGRIHRVLSPIPLDIWYGLGARVRVGADSKWSTRTPTRVTPTRNPQLPAIPVLCTMPSKYDNSQRHRAEVLLNSFLQFHFARLKRVQRRWCLARNRLRSSQSGALSLDHALMSLSSSSLSSSSDSSISSPAASFNSSSGSSSTSSFTQESSSDLDGSGLDGSEYFSQATEDVELWVAGQVATTVASLMSLQDELDIEMEMFFILSSDSESEFDWEENSGDADDEGSETDMMEWETMDYKGLSSSDAAEAQLSAMYAHCYTIPRKINEKPPPQLPFILHHSKHHQPKQFRQCLCVSPYTLDCLVTRIQDSRVFTNNSRNAQMSVEDQLAITLYCFGHYGNAAGLDEVGRWAGVGKGTVLLVTKRVLAAVLAPDMITENLRMPTEEEKKQAKQWVESRSCPAWRDGWCLVDSTLVPLFNRPYWYGESYFDWKCNYSLNFQIVSLPNLCIIDVGYGYTGSTHDATAWEKTQLKQAIDILLRDGEWIWADSAYPISERVVAPFKRPEKDLPQNEVFNNYVSMVRIKSKHAIGFLKGRFPSLKDLHISITDEQSHKLATYWGLGCVVTHNFAMSCEEREQIAEGDFTDNAVMSDPFLIEGLEEDELDNHISGEADGDGY
ncbi:hypothetical protein D9758_013965 [Tetrapyrgos nigripes]|uniref:DDE Tnp4 domain-containing protein n=1 Tax=Tetrapyrgos nigripes TaxID=182062 RepID=A0A8H5G7R3_9AGAR|nr:hypothetical protein D9758_013965 [Tetrapyrgos nigripes]